MNFVCTRCGRKEAVTTRAAHCTCGGLWKLEADLPAFDLSGVDPHEWSLFRYRKFMALEDESWRAVTMGEGMTPVVRLDEDVLLKMDYLMPTLSFKDRGAAVQDSSGNAGNAVAAYCAKAGIACEIFVPEGTSPKKIDMIRAHGAVCTVVPGSRDHCADVCRAKVEQEGVYYANHVYNPFFYEGTKTYIYEAFEQLGRIPSHIVIPTGNGTLFLGAIYALEHLERALGVTAHGTQYGRCFNTVHTARIGHGHALNVLDDVARAGNVHMIGLATECLARQRRCIGNGNRLGAAERTDKLAVQDIAKSGIADGIGRHRYLLLT